MLNASLVGSSDNREGVISRGVLEAAAIGWRVRQGGEITAARRGSGVLSSHRLREENRGPCSSAPGPVAAEGDTVKSIIRRALMEIPTRVCPRPTAHAQAQAQA